MDRIIYDCDTYDYWCSLEDYNGVGNKSYGKFSEGGKAYEIFTKDTPRPWLNYLSNDRVASVISNTGLGFYWYKTSLLRITKYDHLVDYQPRTFKEGREVVITDGDRRINIFRDAENVTCIHRPGISTVKAECEDYSAEMTLFVPNEDPGECISVRISSKNGKRVKVSFSQVWSVARFGIHTADEGIPYTSVPGKDQSLDYIQKGIKLHTDNDELPIEVWCGYVSPDAEEMNVCINKEKRRNGKIFEFPTAELSLEADFGKCESHTFDLFSFTAESEEEFCELHKKYICKASYGEERNALLEKWDRLLGAPSCEIPDKNIELFLNTWLKNQLYTTFRYIRSGYIGYRDTIQDSWGYSLIEPKRAREQILKTLSYMLKDGSCPRNFSPFGKGDRHDMRNTMDSATWIGMCIKDYIEETGDVSILDEEIDYLDTAERTSVERHIDDAMDLLWNSRGRGGFCLTKDGDWNDAIEGISKNGPAVSIWLTIAFYYAEECLAKLYDSIGKCEKAALYRERNKELYHVVKTNGWDGEWYRYAISGDGEYVGSKENEEGKIHLNSNTWAVFSGIASEEETKKIFKSIDENLMTFVGPALIAPPYRKKPCKAGRIVNLEPGTFENGSVYQHAVCFYILALVRAGKYGEAVDSLARLLPTNPENFDSRRASEPYCTGNYYCGPSHARAGQNFFTWFTGNPAWILRISFDEILGVKATLGGLRIDPKVPDSWSSYSVTKLFRGCEYKIKFVRTGKFSLTVDGQKISGNVLPITDARSVEVLAEF